MLTVVACMLIPGEVFLLVSWPEEHDDVSVISSLQASELQQIGDVCSVVEKKKSYPARVHAKGAEM